MTMPAVGASAPDFTLPSTSGESVTLSELRGKGPVLLAFYPLAFSPTCTEEVCQFSNEFDQFAGHGVTVLPISVDSKWTLAAFKAHHNMRVELLSDFFRKAAEAYGVFVPEKLTAARSYFLIDDQGIVRWAYREEHNGLRRENTELLAEIAKLK